MTFVSGGHHTIRQDYRQKIKIIQGEVIVAGTGAVGLGQRFIDITERSWKEKSFQRKSIIDVGRSLAKSTIQDFSQTGANLGSYAALVAVPNRRTAELIEFGEANFQPEVKTKDNWYVSMGSGQRVADPLLGFVRRAFWGNNPPNRQEGIFAVTMVLKLGCSMAPGGVAEPIRIATLSLSRKGRPTALMLDKEDLLEHEDNAEAALTYFGKFPEKHSETETAEQTFPSAPRAS